MTELCLALPLTELDDTLVLSELKTRGGLKYWLGMPGIAEVGLIGGIPDGGEARNLSGVPCDFSVSSDDGPGRSSGKIAVPTVSIGS